MPLKHDIEFTRQTLCTIHMPYISDSIWKRNYHKPEHFWDTQEAWQNGNPERYRIDCLELDAVIIDTLLRKQIPGADDFVTCGYGNTLTFTTGIDSTEALQAQGAVYKTVAEVYGAFTELLERQLAIRENEDAVTDSTELYEEYNDVFGH